MHRQSPLKRGLHKGLRYYPPLLPKAPDTPAEWPPAAARQPVHLQDHPLDRTTDPLLKRPGSRQPAACMPATPTLQALRTAL